MDVSLVGSKLENFTANYREALDFDQHAFGERSRTVPRGHLLFQIRMDYVDEPPIGAGTLGVWHARRIDNLHSNVALQNLGDESFDSATGADDKSQHIGAATFLVERTFNGLNLALQASHAVDYFGFLSNGIKHGVTHVRSFPQNSLQTASWCAATLPA
jgi:hypothetical protein